MEDGQTMSRKRRKPARLAGRPETKEGKLPKEKKQKTGTRPCLCKQCDLRKRGKIGGLNTKGNGPGGVALKSVPAGSAARKRLLEDLGGKANFGDRYELFLSATSLKHRISRAHFFDSQFVVARTGECTTLRADARALVPIPCIHAKRWIADGKLDVRVIAAAEAAASSQTAAQKGAAEMIALAARVRRDGGTAAELTEDLIAVENTFDTENTGQGRNGSDSGGSSRAKHASRSSTMHADGSMGRRRGRGGSRGRRERESKGGDAAGSQPIEPTPQWANISDVSAELLKPVPASSSSACPLCLQHQCINVGGMTPCNISIGMQGPNSLLAIIDGCSSATEEVDDFDGGANMVSKAEEQAVYEASLDWMMQDIGSSNVDSNSFIEQQMPGASGDLIRHEVVFEKGTGGQTSTEIKAGATGELFINC